MRRPAVPAAAAALALSGCAVGPYVEVPIEIPIEAKLDLSTYGRVLVGSFVTQCNENLDLDAETSRLLRNQLRLNSRLGVIEAEVEPLGDFSDAALESSGLEDRFDEMAADAVAVGDGEIPGRNGLTSNRTSCSRTTSTGGSSAKSSKNP